MICKCYSQGYMITKVDVIEDLFGSLLKAEVEIKGRRKFGGFSSLNTEEKLQNWSPADAVFTIHAF
jgi:hypothetical protein